MGDRDMVRENSVWPAVPYAVSKAALNMVVAKFDAKYREKGVMFLAISPGLVDTGEARKHFFYPFVADVDSITSSWRRIAY